MTKLQELLKQINRKHVYIQTHNFPDPDAIASALGIQELLKHNGISSTICYKGKIDRYSTDKLREILDIRLVNIEDIDSELTSAFSSFIGYLFLPGCILRASLGC